MQITIGARQVMFGSAGCTDPGHLVAQATELCVMAPDSGSSVWNFLYVTFLVPRILR